jgi:hypothetical protein
MFWILCLHLILGIIPLVYYHTDDWSEIGSFNETLIMYGIEDGIDGIAQQSSTPRAAHLVNAESFASGLLKPPIKKGREMA